jgi:hypothetical protein
MSGKQRRWAARRAQTTAGRYATPGDSERRCQRPNIQGEKGGVLWLLTVAETPISELLTELDEVV